MQLIQLHSADEIFHQQVWMVSDGGDQFVDLSNQIVTDSDTAACFFDIDAAVQVAVDATARQRMEMN